MNFPTGKSQRMVSRLVKELTDGDIEDIPIGVLRKLEHDRIRFEQHMRSIIIGALKEELYELITPYYDQGYISEKELSDMIDLWNHRVDCGTHGNYRSVSFCFVSSDEDIRPSFRKQILQPYMKSLSPDEQFLDEVAKWQRWQT